MSRRIQTKVPKYSLVKFLCDGKTLQTKTKDLQWNGQLKVNATAKALWCGRYLHCTILGLSDDLTILNEVERTFMKSLRKLPSDKARGSNLKPNSSVQRRTSLLVNKARQIQMKKKASQGIEFIPNVQKSPEIQRPDRLPKSYDLSSLSVEDRVRVSGVVEGGVSSCVSSNPSDFPSSSPPDTTISDTAAFSLGTSSHSFLDLLTTPTLFNMDTQELTTQPPSQTIPNPFVPPSLIPTVSPTNCEPDDWNSQRRNDDNPRTLDGIYDRLEAIMTFMRRLEEKVDAAVQREPTSSTTISTQTEPVSSPHPVIIEDIPQTVCVDKPAIVSPTFGIPATVTPALVTSANVTSANVTPAADTPAVATQATVTPAADTPTVVTPATVTAAVMPEQETTQPTFEIFRCDDSFWCLFPQQLESVQVTPGYLKELTRNVHSPVSVCEDQLIIDSDLLSSLLKRSHSASHLAKNILFNCFTLRELYNKNAYGKTFRTNGVKKAPLNLTKMKTLMDTVKLHFKEVGIEKTVTDSVNSALRHLWGRKLNRHWLVF